MQNARTTRLAETLAQETRQAIAQQDLDTALGQVIELAVELGVCDQASITQRLPGGGLTTTAPTGELVVTADKLQYLLHQGPCVDAAYDDDVLVSGDIATDGRWPAWGPQAATLGLGGIISVHLYTDAGAMGALNLYSTQPRAYTVDDLDVARLVATHASIALAHFRGQAHLWKTVDARHTIGLAQGILMHQFGIGAEPAFAVLRRMSQDTNTKLHLIAVDVIRNGQLPPQDTHAHRDQPTST